MKKFLLLSAFLFAAFNGFAQTDKVWSTVKDQNIKKNKYVERESFPQEFKLIQLELSLMKQVLLTAPNRNFKSNKGIVISLPNASGGLENFEVFEASNFDSDLQSQFPEIRSYVGRGIDDKTAVVRLSIDPRGVNSIVSRADRGSELMEPYSQDGKILAVYVSSTVKGKLPFTCSTVDQVLVNDLVNKASSVSRSSSGQLLNFRLAMSVTPEYTAYHGGTKALALAAINTTMTRVNGVFEKDFSIHMNLVNNMTIIYDGSVADPYGATDANYNSELQATLTSVVGDANYDVGHLMGRVGNNGNAGCIGCVCNTGKGSGYTTSTVPVGDNFDIDFVAHEIGHQFGANHTFSNSNEGSGVNVEVGSGVTIMGYAGITSYDTHLHSIDVFHAASIAQVQANMAGKTCPTVINLTHGAPIVNAGLDLVIPKSTPFLLEGSATDSNGDAMNFVWEQNDDGVGQTNNNSRARANKATGPNWSNYLPTTTGKRYFPTLTSVIANSSTTAGLDITAEALSSVARTLNFRLTARDNNILGGQTGFDDKVLTVSSVAGPFAVTAPNTAVSWAVGTNQVVTWNVAGTTINGVNTQNVDIYLSTDGGYTYSILLASKVPNDGSETITVPNILGSSNRIMVKGYDHVFFDISNANFSITAATSTFGVAFNGIAGEQNKDACQGAIVAYVFPYSTFGGFSASTVFTVTGQPVGSTVVFTPANTTAAGTINMQVSNTSGSAPGLYNMIVTGTSGGTTKTVPFYLNLMSGNFGTQNLASPANAATAQSTSLTLTWSANAAASSYDVEVATDAGFSSIIASVNVTTASYNLSGLSDATTYYWRVKPKNTGCEGTFSSAFNFQTGQSVCASTSSTNIPVNIPDNTTVTSTITIAAGSNISDVNLTANISHTWIGDAVATITSPQGTVVQLFSRPCDANATNGNVVATFDDAGSAPVCPGIFGTVTPTGNLSDFNGENPIGVWTLSINDQANNDTGTLNSWSLNICSVQPLASESFGTIQNLAIYPNPNNGAFNIQFTSSSSNEIKVNVHDMRGREIFNRAYQNNGLFNESLQLNNVQSGIYLVTVQDGSKKTTKKIVVE